jgi:hypothetical protein
MLGYNDLKDPSWSINFSPSYSFFRSRSRIAEKFKTTKRYSLSTSANIKFTNIWSVSWGSNYDFTKNKFMNHSLSFYCDLECFDMRFNWSPSGFNKGSFRFFISLRTIKVSGCNNETLERGKWCTYAILLPEISSFLINFNNNREIAHYLL